MSLPERVSTQCIVQLIGMVPGCVERLLSRSVAELPSCTKPESFSVSVVCRQ